jgi:hypothetical protein
MEMWAESSKDVVDTWPKCIGSVGDGGGGSDRIVTAGGWAAAVDEHALGGAALGEPIFCPVCCEGAVGERAGPGPGVRLSVDPAGELAVVAVGGLPAALGAPADTPR